MGRETHNCSTLNTFDITKVNTPGHRKPHGTMSRRKEHWSYVQRMMRNYFVTYPAISEYTGLPMSTVKRCLDLNNFLTCHYINVGRVRLATELLLHRAGYDVDLDASVQTLWDEYDVIFSEAL